MNRISFQLLLFDEAKESYTMLVASVGLDLDQLGPVFFSKEGPLIQLLRRRREPVVKEELEWVPVGHETLQTVETMAKLCGN